MLGRLIVVLGASAGRSVVYLLSQVVGVYLMAVCVFKY